FGPRECGFSPPKASARAGELSRVKPETRAEVAVILERKLKRALTEDELKPDTRLDALGLDSLETMSVVLDIEQRFGYFSDEPPITVGDLWLIAEGLIEQKPPQPAPEVWFKKRTRTTALRIDGETLAEAFIHRALADPSAVIAADDQAGVTTYGRLLIGTLTLARRFVALPGSNV